ncbi:MAG: PTS transporter subunit EIIA, partial [Gammaproteobacteria bacterium]|nr:PTS transporter subunit EIIA [Gammaproteobacteria bacterium]
MDIESILNPERVFGSLQASSKKRAIELAADKIAASLPEADTGTIYRNLIEREKLGTTAIGHGVAIPHCRLAESETITGGLFVFEEPIDFSAHDDQPV